MDRKTLRDTFERFSTEEGFSIQPYRYAEPRFEKFEELHIFLQKQPHYLVEDLMGKMFGKHTPHFFVEIRSSDDHLFYFKSESVAALDWWELMFGTPVCIFFLSRNGLFEPLLIPLEDVKQVLKSVGDSSNISMFNITLYDELKKTHRGVRE